MLREEEKNQLKERFPKNIELSFGRRLQSIVQTDLYMIIPKGKKCALWFTFYKNKNVCIMIEIDNSRNISNMYIKDVCFSDELSYGSIFVGTIFKYKHNNTDLFEFFTLEHIKYYKGQDVSSFSFEKQMFIYDKIFQNDLRCINKLPNFLNILLPAIKTSYNDAFDLSQQLKYNVYGIKFWNLKDNHCIGDLPNNIQLPKINNHIHLENKSYYNHKNNNNYNEIEKNNDIEKNKNQFENSKNIKQHQNYVFLVKCNPEFDSYSLFGLNNKKQPHYFAKANIPDYKTSVMMNKIFRKIKENENLDLLEESDDEDEFENIDENKYVDLEKSQLMYCSYLHKFKMWKPLSIANKDDDISEIPTFYNNKISNIINNKVKLHSYHKTKFNCLKKFINKVSVNNSNKLN